MKSAMVVILIVITMLSMGCSGEGVFENPDSIEVTTFNAIQGKQGHLVNFEIGKDTTGITKRAVLALQDAEVSPYPLYIVFKSGNAGLHKLIDLIRYADDVAIVSNLPENTKPLTRLYMNSGEGNPYEGFLRIIGSTETQYLSIRGTFSDEKRDWYLTQLAQPPETIYTTPIIDVDEITYDDLMFYIHGDGTTAKTAAHTHDRQNQQDFFGCVYIPKVNMESNDVGAVRFFAQPVEGVTVTIISGSRSGESTITDKDGQYIFKDVREDELHLRVEKEHLESKEVIVHKSRRTILANGDVPNYSNDPQKNPGNILIGQKWPDFVRPILQRIPTVVDPLLIVINSNKRYGGFYVEGVVVIDQHIYAYVDVTIRLFVHEIAHMRQHAVVSPSGSESISNWVHTPEGKAFAEARQKDWDEVGKIEIDHIDSLSSLIENSAEICAYYWTNVSNEDIKITTPNRYRWAHEWLNK